MPKVCGIETRSTQSNVSPTGKSSSSALVRSLTCLSSLSIWLGENAGAITRRCAVWIG